MAKADTNRRNFLLFATDMEPTGGGNCVGAWALQAFMDDWDVTVICRDKPDIEALNRQFGTSLDSDRISLISLSRPVRWLSRRIDPHPSSIWPLAFLIRKVHRIGRRFDVILSINNEVDLGRPGLQYVHVPIHGKKMPVLREYSGASILTRIGGFLRGEYRPWMAVTRSDSRRIESNVFLANSNWTANEIRKHYPVDPIVLYPPVRRVECGVDWKERRAAFVMLGRISIYKRQMVGIEILEEVRKRGHEVELHIIGDPNRNDGGSYFRQVCTRVKQVSDWVHLHVSVERHELESIVSRCRFGLHLHHQEHFGIAIAEMMSSGCIVLAPNDGGQVEIVGTDSGLLFEDPSEAVEKICALLADERRQRELSERQCERAQAFSADAFMSNLRCIVEKYYD